MTRLASILCQVAGRRSKESACPSESGEPAARSVTAGWGRTSELPLLVRSASLPAVWIALAVCLAAGLKPAYAQTGSEANSEGAPATLFDTAAALDSSGRQDEALAAYRQLAMQYPGTPWAARADLAAARSLVRDGDAPAALEILARVRGRFGGRADVLGPELGRALAWSTLLYRLYLRPSIGRPPYAPAGRTLKGSTDRLDDVIAVAVDREDVVFAARENGAVSFKPDGSSGATLSALDAQNLMLLPNGKVAVVRKGGLTFDGAPPAQLTMSRPDRTVRPLEGASAGVALSTGELLVADASTRSILRFTSDGKHIGRFADADAIRMAIDSLDNVALLDRGSRAIVVLGRDGRPVARVPRRGTGYELRNPVDIAYDSLDHLHVLDRDSGTVFVFGPQGQVVTQFSIPENAPGSFRRARAFGIDSLGRLYIYDDRGGLQVYQ